MRAIRRLFFIIISFFTLAFTRQAIAEPIIDYIPVSAQLNQALADDVSGARHWVVTVAIKNQGNVPGQPRTMKIRINSNLFTAQVYGGAASGGVLYGRINPGETGLARIALPSDQYDFVQGLARCSVNARIHIDTDRSKQVHYLDYVFTNDIKTLPLKDMLWVRRCQIRGPITRPLPPILQ